MNARYNLLGFLVVLLCGSALAGEPPGSAPKSGAAPAPAAKHDAIEEIVVQARLPEPPAPPRPELAVPRFTPPPLTITEPTVPAVPAASPAVPDRLADAGTKPKL
ncbi:MAG TPA: hypothetical protein VFV10_09320 [Gammaproteobacteria bacterium]|nr:hypothetical protein [Gammaproteobacteria bacterium]